MPPASVLLTTERLELSRFTAADLEHLVALDSDPEVMRFLTGGIPTPAAFIEERVLPRFLRYDAARPELGYWATRDRATGEFIGWFGFRRAEDRGPGDVELGYRLRRAVWGRGYATEGVRALLALGFSRLGAARVVATTYEANLASRRVLDKAGFRLVRRFRMRPEQLGGTFDGSAQPMWDGDDLELAVERADWCARARLYSGHPR
jgi:RimJ/RimL family protein N-acetyltransferase